MSGIAGWLYCCFVHDLHFLSSLDVAGCCDVILRSCCLSSGCVWMWLIFPCVLCNESVKNRVNERQILSVPTFAVQWQESGMRQLACDMVFCCSTGTSHKIQSGVKSQNIGVYSFQFVFQPMQKHELS